MKKEANHQDFRDWLETVDLATGSGIPPAPSWDEEIPDEDGEHDHEFQTVPFSSERRQLKPARYR